jgi:hypothetical protein
LATWWWDRPVDVDGSDDSSTANCSASTIGGAGVGRNISGDLAGGGVACALVLGGSRYTLQAKSNADNSEPTQRKYLKIGIGMIRSLENAIGICIDAVDWQARPIRADYRALPNATPVDKTHAGRASVSNGGVAPAHSINSLHARPACLAHRRNHVVLLDGRDRHGLCGRGEAQEKNNGDEASHLVTPQQMVWPFLYNHLKSIESDVPLSKRLVRISDRLTPI